jgi:hypothetical protein
VKITTPLGDYDYRVERIGVRDGRLVVDGRLGEWETTMVVDRSDLLELVRRAAPALALISAGAFVALRHRRV